MDMHTMFVYGMACGVFLTLCVIVIIGILAIILNEVGNDKC